MCKGQTEPRGLGVLCRGGMLHKAGALQKELFVVCFCFIFLVLEMEPRILHVPAKYFTAKFVLQAS